MFKAFILGLVQGVTEFLPISSSGHLVLFQELSSTHYGPDFDVMLHAGTLLATIIYFRHKILELTKADLRNIIIASIPASIAAIFLVPHLKYLFSSLTVVAIGLMVTTVFLYLSKRLSSSAKKSITTSRALKIGLSQALALFPGVSRSGSTISTALIQGNKKEDSFTFSFLLSIPAILGATLISFNQITWSQSLYGIYISGIIAAFISGYISLKVLHRLIIKSQFHNFAYYTLFLSLLTFFILK